MKDIPEYKKMFSPKLNLLQTYKFHLSLGKALGYRCRNFNQNRWSRFEEYTESVIFEESSHF